MVSVKMRCGKLPPKVGDFVDAIIDASIDIVLEHPDRIKKSVVVASYGSENDREDADLMRDALDPLFQNGIPFVTSSGNDGSAHPIDKLPDVLTVEEDYPVIIVGGVHRDRKRAAYSQGGALLTVYAPGGRIDSKEDAVEGQSPKDEEPVWSEGTSNGE